MSVLNSGWPHRGESLTPWELGPPADSDTDPGHLPKEDPEETSEQDPEILSLGVPGLDTNWAPNQPGLRILLQQLPPQDSDERYCLALGEDELAELRLFCAQRRREALGQGVALLVPPELPEHTCEKLIFSRRCTEAEGRRWHENHFCCQDCAGPLGGGLYALPGGGPCCPSCFESRYSVSGSSRAQTLEGEAGVDRVEERDRTPLDAATVSRAALLVAASRSSLETQRELLGSSPRQQRRTGDKVEAPTGREQGRLETPLDACSTCSSSSDSEPEGFFLGQRLPGPWKTPRSLQAGDSDTSRKHCTIC
ncbi:prickle-like protein 4 isoform X3 [Prionailurus viverrinus]|uniref:prickle-like protein 4 isoform X3 n=1 Tax=Prionailurus viverrinus TaxID=61388 RepID=UPI001FF20EA2|nr:prickle-like protein 4 isoform X3 [Prionailurus viverrinus]